MARTYPADVPRTALGQFGQLGRLVIRLWEELRKAADSDPHPHHLTHMVGGTDQFPKPPDPLPVIAGVVADAAPGAGPGFMRQDAQLVALTGVPAALANAAAEGTSTNVPRLDHQHKRDVRVQVDGVDVGTRNALNFMTSPDTTFQAIDDSVNDKVTVSATGRGLGSATFFPTAVAGFFPIADPPFFTGG